MSLSSGQSLSFYEILGPLGAGGMGEVYRAKDTRLDREVAIKVLQEEMAGDEERLRRFEREAKTLASLNHTNIGGIYGVDQVGEICFLALELVPGEDLSERLQRGALPSDEAIDVCRQIAEGLEVAHEAGVVHRDLKPANIRITPEGVVKVLDFGLAKPIRPETTKDGTRAAKPDSFIVTEEGLVLGTPTYMSPEQARGRPVDKRTDIWAFGCVLYECLTGKRAFEGEAFGDLMAAILSREPELGALPAATPSHVRTLLERTLAKDPRARLRDIGEARVALESSSVEGQGLANGSGHGSNRSALMPLACVAVGLAAGLGIGLLGAGNPSSGPGDSTMQPLSVHIPKDRAIRSDNSPAIALSPNGRVLAWVGGEEEQIHVRSLDALDIWTLPGTEYAAGPFFSPDSERIGFARNDALHSIQLHGGASKRLAETEARTTFFRGACWGDDAKIALSASIRTGISLVAEIGGAMESLTLPDTDAGERTHRFPDLLPGGEVLLFTRDDNRSSEFHDDAFIVARSLRTGDERVVVEGAGQARFAAGHIIFVRGADLYAQAFDPKTLSVSGVPRKIVSGVECSTTSGMANFALARDGTLAYAPGLDRSQSKRIAWRRAGEEPKLLDIPPGSYIDVTSSPDGRFISYVLQAPEHAELWIYDVEQDKQRLRTRLGDMLSLVWSPNSDKLYFGSGTTLDPAIYAVEVAGTSDPQIVFRGSSEARVISPVSITPKGDALLASVDYLDQRRDIHRIELASGTSSEVITTPGREVTARIDPSGKWIAFDSNVTGDFQVYLTTLEPGGPTFQVSRETSRAPRWSADGKLLYYKRSDANSLCSVGVQLGDSPAVDAPRVVFEEFDNLGISGFDVAPDGSVLCYVSPEAREEGREIRIQRDWLKVPSAGSQ